MQSSSQKNRLYVQLYDITGSKIADEEIRQTLEDLEKQVRSALHILKRLMKTFVQRLANGEKDRVLCYRERHEYG